MVSFEMSWLLPILVIEIILTIPLTLIHIGWKTADRTYVAGIHEMREDIVKDKLGKMQEYFLNEPINRKRVRY